MSSRNPVAMYDYPVEDELKILANYREEMSVIEELTGFDGLDISDIKDIINDMNNDLKEFMKSRREKIQENKELKKRIEILEKENKKLVNNGGYVGEGCANHIASQLKDDLIIRLKEENKDLGEEIENIKKQIFNLNSKFN